jgi:hypothetical protein
VISRSSNVSHFSTQVYRTQESENSGFQAEEASPSHQSQFSIGLWWSLPPSVSSASFRPGEHAECSQLLVHAYTCVFLLTYSCPCCSTMDDSEVYEVLLCIEKTVQVPLASLMKPACVRVK